MPELDRFIDKYCDALRDENAAIFAGAGLSIPAGLVDWTHLMRDIAADIGLDVDREHDLLSVAQFHVNERSGRHRINQALITEFAERASLTENHTLLSSLPIRTYWTTNYDTLIEQSLRSVRKRVDVKATEQSLALTLPRRDAVVYKMHGDVARVDEAVITRDDYEAYITTHPLFGTALQGDLISKTFLFIGFSFSDPNLSYILSRIRLLLGQNRRDHYCLLRRVQRTNFSSDSEFDYSRSRQDLQVRDLRRYGIHGLLVDSYAEYTAVLRRITTRYRRRRVFVSGSAVTYAPFSERDAHELMHSLGTTLIEHGFDVVTGFGHGVGAFLFNGVLEGLAREGTESMHDRVTLRPFPQGVDDPGLRAERWLRYRRDMISAAGIAVFLFGNQTGGSPVHLASGVRKEFELAVEAGVAVVPVGATGYVARELYDETMRRFDEFFPSRADLRGMFAALNTETNVRKLVAATVAAVEAIATGT